MRLTDIRDIVLNHERVADGSTLIDIGRPFSVVVVPAAMCACEQPKIRSL
jgi:hypothetical protein